MNLNKILITALIVLLVVGSVFAAYKDRQYKKEIVSLRNNIAEKDKTIEISQGVFVKKSLEVSDLKKLLDTSSEENKKLKTELEKNNEKIVVLNELNVKLKKDYESNFQGKQTVVVQNNVKRDKVEFDKDFSLYKVSGFTLTNPAEVYLKFSQTKPLQLTLSLTQDSSGVWKTYTTTNNDFSVDIKLSSVDPFFFKKKWYESLGLVSNIGAGYLKGSRNAIFGIGLSYDFYKFTLGPMVWFSTTGIKDSVYGISFIYRPFLR